MMPAGAILAALRGRLAEAPSRTGSLIITIYGDAVVPRGGSLALGSLADICGALGIGDGVVRTAASRLAAEGWLARRRVGRNSFYRLAEPGRATFAEATARIYGATDTPWDGRFTLILAANGGAAAPRGEGHRIGRLGPGLLVAPPAEAGAGAPAPDGLRLRAEPADPDQARRIAARAWPLEAVAARYARFLACLEAPRAEATPADRSFADRDALLLRILLIHEYRKVLLRDPLLPAALLPPDWPGHRARRQCADLYRRLVPASERWLDRHAVAEAGPLPPPGPEFRHRFADLAR